MKLTHVIAAWALVKSMASALAERAVSALAWFLALGLGGTCMIVAGIWINFGLGCALIAGGIAMLAGAIFIRKGMTDE